MQEVSAEVTSFKPNGSEPIVSQLDYTQIHYDVLYIYIFQIWFYRYYQPEFDSIQPHNGELYQHMK